MIDGIQVHDLRIMPDDRGAVMHMLRADDEHFQGFGEIYFSSAYPGAVKGWHRHSVMTLNYAVVVGSIKLGLYDDRPGSSTRGTVMTLYPGVGNYVLVTVPAGVWNGFCAIGDSQALVANCSTSPHDPDEIERADPFGSLVPYRWGVRHG